MFNLGKNQGGSLRERLLAQMQGGGPVQFMSPFGQSLPNRAGAADVPNLVLQLRHLLESGQLSLEDIFQSGPEMSAEIGAPEAGAPYQSRGEQARQALLDELSQRQGRPVMGGKNKHKHKHKHFGGRTDQGRHPRGGHPMRRDTLSFLPHRHNIMKHRSRGPRIKAPSLSHHYQVANRGTRVRRIAPVMRYSPVREIPMGRRRAESARSTRPSPTRYIGGPSSRARYI